jgi:hypothetical protein
LGNLFDTAIDIVCVLGGRTNLGPARLSSLYRPRESEQYLIFSTMTVRLNFGRHWFPFDKMGLKQFS